MHRTALFSALNIPIFPRVNKYSYMWVEIRQMGYYVSDIWVEIGLRKLRITSDIVKHA